MFDVKKLLKPIICFAALAHIIIFISMLYLRIMPMVYYNCFSILFYGVSIFWVDKDRINIVYYGTYAEIMVHSVIATLCLGWSYGFIFYLFALLPVGFYMEYLKNSASMNMKIPFMLGMLDFLVFLLCRVISGTQSAMYVQNNDVAGELFYIFNFICTCVALISFSTIFSMELRAGNNKLTQMNNELAKFAKLDALTGLYNRRGMEPYFDEFCNSGKNFFVCLCDIDDFKRVNDSYGHEAGDDVIKTVARIIRHDIRTGDYVCRWGGEEFVFMITADTEKEAIEVVEAIRSDIENFVMLFNGTCIRFTLTLGVTHYNQGENIGETIARADENMYQGKRAGKNVVVMGT